MKIRVGGIVILFSLFFSTSLFSQFNVGFQFNHLYGFNNANAGHIGGGLRGEVSLNNELALTMGYNYFHNAVYQNKVNAKAYSTLQIPQTIPQDIESVMNLNQFYLGVTKYIKGTHYTFKPESEFGVYLIGELGVIVGGMKVHTEENLINSEYYDIPVADNSLQAFTDLNLHGGIGFDKMRGPVYFYANFIAAAKIIRVVDTGGAVKLPFFLTSNVGFRLLFGEY